MTMRTARKPHAACCAAILAVALVGTATVSGQYNQQKQMADAAHATADSALSGQAGMQLTAGAMLGQYSATLQLAVRAADANWDQMSPEKRAAYTNFVQLSAQQVGSSRVDLQACKLEYSIVSPK